MIAAWLIGFLIGLSEPIPLEHLVVFTQQVSVVSSRYSVEAKIIMEGNKKQENHEIEWD